MTTFKALVPAHKVTWDPQRPAHFPGVYPESVAVRDSLTLTSWLLLGGLLQGLAIASVGPAALIPTFLILLYRTIDQLLMAYNLNTNRYMTGVVPTKYSTQAPHSDGTFGVEPASESIVVFHLGARPNHPLGFFAPGMREVTKRFEEMVEELNADPVKHGLLGATRWTKDDPAGNEIMTVFYLRDYTALHRFANGGLHLDTIKWWSSIVKDHPHIAIYHETYIIPKGQWENIYINSTPTGLGDTWFPVTREVEGKETVTQIVRPIVDARSGVQRTAAKRFNLAQLKETQQPDAELFDKTYAS